MRKWLLNGTDDHIKEVKELLLARIQQVDDHACPVIERGGTPFTREDHQEICDQNAKITAGKHELVMSEIGHLRDAQKINSERLSGVKEDVKTILRKVGG